MMTLRRMLDGWKRDAANQSWTELRAAIRAGGDIQIAVRVSELAIAAGALAATELSSAITGSISDFVGLQTRHALACAGLQMPPTERHTLPATANGGLAALALGGPDEAAHLLPGPDPERLHTGDVEGSVRRLIAVVRDGRGNNAALQVWRELVFSCADREADAATLLWAARIIVHDIQAQPLESVAAWVREKIEHEIRYEDQGATTNRQRARVDLLDDADRLARRPEACLLRWQSRAKPVDQLVDTPLATLGVQVSRSVLVDPSQPPASAARILQRLVEHRPTSTLDQLAVADAMSALACAGMASQTDFETLANCDPDVPAIPLLTRLRLALIALAHGNVNEAERWIPALCSDVNDQAYVAGDIVTLVGYLIRMVRGRAQLLDIAGPLDRAGEQLDSLSGSGQLDEPTMLWLARVMFHRLDRQPLGEVARLAHDWLWSIPTRLEEARREAPSHTPSFPIRRTLDRGAYIVEKRLKAGGHSGLYRGVEGATGRRVVIAMDGYRSSSQSIPELRAAVRDHAPGLFELAHVGLVADDDLSNHWAVVEYVPEGDWLPNVLGPADPVTAPSKAIQLGVSAGLILVDAWTAGIDASRMRPEFMWARRTGAGYEVTGLTWRPLELFDRYRADAYTHELFERHYFAGEAAPYPRRAPDDRAVTFVLAAMMAEWATGRFPLELYEGSRAMNPYGIRTAHPIDAPAPLRELLERALVHDRDARPRLVDFVNELASLPIT